MLNPLNYGSESKKNFEMNKHEGQRQWYLQKDFITDWVENMNQQEQASRLSMPKKINKKWDELRDLFDASE